MTVSANRCYSGRHKATEEEGDNVILGNLEEIWRKKCTGWAKKVSLIIFAITLFTASQVS